ncbi:RNA polymerase sigma factor [Cryptosporangium minutisporangium]|uniref:Sigma-70 family RNA polymerase sigma factor n=1 Tax=Cryptosporangium minutisporangium TaxID=113569 RepID=A0ABP6SSJ2_9ACTN
MPTEHPVQALVEAALAGDERAWNAIVDRYASLLWAVCRGFGLSTTDTDDVVQVVWLRLLEHLPGLAAPAALPGWLITTTRRECLQHARVSSGRARREAPLLVEPGADLDDLDDELLRAERRAAMRAAFRQLGERCRRLLGLLLTEPRPSYVQISAELGLAIGSIGPIRARCLDDLRRAPELAALLAAPTGGA